MRPAATTADQNDHVAAAAYLMKHAGATALVVLDGQQTNRPIGIITEADIVRTVADGKDVNDVRIYDLMTARPAVISAATSIHDAAEAMTNGRFRHLPVVEDDGLIGRVDVGSTEKKGACRSSGSVPNWRPGALPGLRSIRPRRLLRAWCQS